jgi:hypothetical protein
VSVGSAGARDRRGSRRTLSRIWRDLALILTSIVAIAVCTRDDRVPERLVDGSRAEVLPIALQDMHDRAILTKAHVVDSTDVEPGSLASDCLRGRARGSNAQGPLVARIGVDTETVTFYDGSGLRGCDNSTGPREGERRWCGGAFGLLENDRLSDPRLDIGCTTRDGERVGFIWVEPSSEARYVVAHHPDFAEVYEVAAGLPIRVATTTGVNVEEARAAFELSEHDVHGGLLRRYVIDTMVAG